MLFDLKGKRKRLVQVVYLGLAILFGGGLVLFGVGGSVSGGLIDAFTGNGGGGSTSAFRTRSNAPSRRAARNPQDPSRPGSPSCAPQFNLASSPEGSDAQTGAAHRQGAAGDLEVAQAWERYLKLKPKKLDPSAAAVRRARLRRAAGLRQGGQDAGALA